MSNLGKAVFTIEANTTAFVQGMILAHKESQRTTAAIKTGLQGLQIIPRQLAAVNQSVMATTNAISLLTEKIDKLNTASRGGRGGGGGFGGNPAMSLLFLSQGIEDLQYGFSAIVNNIPMLVMSLGGSAGLAGALSITAVAVNQLIKHWDDLSDRFQAAWSGSTIEQLQKVRDAAKEAAEAWDKLTKTPNEFEAKGAKQLQEAMLKGDPGKWLEAVFAGVAGKEGMAATPEQMVKKDFWRATAGMKQLQQMMDEANRETARDLLIQAGKSGAEGDNARKKLLGMEGLPEEMKATIRGTDPAEQKRQAWIARQMKMNEAQMADEKEAGDKRKRQTEMLNQEGFQNEEFMKREQEQQMRERAAALRKADAEAKQRRHVLWRAEDIGDDFRDAMRRNQRAEFMDAASAWKSSQLAILNGPADLQKQQLDTLKRIERLIADNPQMKGQIMAAVAGNPP